VDKELPPFWPEGDAHISNYLISYIEEDFADWGEKFPKRIEKPGKPKVEISVLVEIMKSRCEDYDLIKALVEYLNKDRVEEYNTWLDVGFCLYIY
jgi:hypothetical protein